MTTVDGKKPPALQARQELDRRLIAFDFPIGWQRYTFNMLRTVSRKHSMELFNRAGTICVHIFQGISLSISL
jgi:hypothetical protein